MKNDNQAEVNVGSDTPKNYQEEVQCTEKDQWIEKFDSHLVKKLGANINTIRQKSTLVYKKKYSPTSAIERYKAHWVVKSFQQIEGIDEDETLRVS